MKGFMFAVLAAGCLAAQGAAAQDAESGRAAIVRDLLSGDRGKVNEALGRLPPFAYDTPYPEGYVTVELVEALITALEVEKRLRDEGSLDPYLELNLSLVSAIAATRHPLTIDVLLRSAWGDGIATNALLDFGPGGLPRAAALAVSPEATPYEADGALRVLGIALERWGAERLAPDIREAVKDAAILHLEGPPDHFASTARQHIRDFQFDNAVDIAKLLGDPELTAVARKARHPTNGKPGDSTPLAAVEEELRKKTARQDRR